MKRTEYIVGTFTDFTDTERQFVMAAVSIHDETFINIEEDYCDIDNDEKVLSIGISVCRPKDEFNEVLGKRIAEGKATKYRNHALYTTDAGLINETVVKALLMQEADYFKVNPGRYLAGYDKDAAKYKKDIDMKKYIDNLSADGKAALTYIAGIKEEVDIQDFVDAVNHVSEK